MFNLERKRRKREFKRKKERELKKRLYSQGSTGVMVHENRKEQRKLKGKRSNKSTSIF